MQSGSLSPILERHTPQHPLPAEIEKMGEEGTVCQFCGVSYLIHREIKKLEDRIEELEKEIDEGNQAKRNEALLKVDLHKLTEKYKLLASKFDQKELAMREIERDVEVLSQKLQTAVLNKEEFQSRIKHLEGLNRNIKTNMSEQVESLVVQVKESKIFLSTMRNEVNLTNKHQFVTIESAKSDILDAISKFDLRNQNDYKIINDLNDKLASKSRNEEVLQASIKLMENELHGASEQNKKICEDLKVENDQLKRELAAAQAQVYDSQQQIVQLQSQLGVNKSNMSQIGEALDAKKQELHAATQKLHMLENESEATVRRLHQEIKILENDIDAMQSDTARWKETEKALLSQQDQMKMMLNTTSGESRQINEHVETLKGELEALKSERSLMIVSHQNQISQLKETFKERLRKANGDPDGVEETIRNLKQSHKREMMELETHMKERYDIELALVKEKHEEQLKTYSQRHKELMENDSLEWKRRAELLQNEVNVSKNLMSALKSEHSRSREDNEKEKIELKNMIAGLEETIVSLTGEHDDVAVNLKVEMKDLKEKLTDCMEEKNRLEEKTVTLTKEISVLQETVRRECEERFELTEALSKVQEQMKNGGAADAAPLRTPVSVINKMSRHNSLSSRDSHDGSVTNGIQRHGSGASLESLSEIKATDSMPRVKDVMFNGNHTARNMSNAKSEELAELARRRIAAAIKRK